MHDSGHYQLLSALSPIVILLFSFIYVIVYLLLNQILQVESCSGTASTG